MRYFGQQGLISRIREHCRLARLFANWVDDSPDFEMLAPVPFALVCFRAVPKNRVFVSEELMENYYNEFNEEIMNEINASGAAYLSHTKLNGKFAIRLSIGNIKVEEKHIEKVWNLLNEKLQSKI